MSSLESRVPVPGPGFCRTPLRTASSRRPGGATAGAPGGADGGDPGTPQRGTAPKEAVSTPPGALGSRRSRPGAAALGWGSRGAWRSLVSALVWGTRGPRFKSGRPDERKAPSKRGFSHPLLRNWCSAVDTLRTRTLRLHSSRRSSCSVKIGGGPISSGGSPSFPESLIKSSESNVSSWTTPSV